MNAAQQMQLAAVLADALEKSGIVIERPVSRRGNVTGHERLDPGSVAARTIGAWLSWGWIVAAYPASAPAPAVATNSDPQQSHLRLMPRERRLNNDAEDDGA